MKIKMLDKQKILILGLGITGFETALSLEEYKNNIIIVENNPNNENYKLLIKKGFKIIDEKEFIDNKIIVDIILKSPGIKFNHPILVSTNAKIINDIELAYLFIKEQKLKTKIIAITGTNGKTSVTLFLEQLLQNANYKVQVAGNIGLSPLTILNVITDLDYLILELSSFQLKTIQKFQPYASFITNITPDHLNYHESFDDYVNSKLKIFSNQSENEKLYVKNKVYLKYLQNKEIKPQIIMNNVPKDIKEQIGECNLASLNYNNALLCYLFAQTEEISFEVFLKTIKSIGTFEHRVEYITEINGIKYYNDSKATNLPAMKEALNKLENIILLVGGASKNEDLTEFNNYLTNVKTVIAYGQNAAEFKSPKIVKTVRTLDEAFNLAHDYAQKGDVVLLSPASASFDQYADYKKRGEHFKQLVNRKREM